MADAREMDLAALDRDVARAARTGSIDDVRRVAKKATWDALGELRAQPLRDALRRWVFALLLLRVSHEEDRRLSTAARERRVVFQGKTPRRASWAEAWRGVVAAKTRAEARLWFDVAAESSEAISCAARARAEKRREAAARLGAAHPWEPLVPVAPAALRHAAARFLDASDEIARATWREALRDEPRASAADVMHLAAAREAGEGWPSRLTARWLRETFDAAARSARIDLPPLPPELGASSFARACAAYGYALRVSFASTASPFALSHEPAFVAAHRLAFVFGALAADPEFHARVLHVSHRVALAQARTLARTALLDARIHAMRLLLTDDAAFFPRDSFEELTSRVLHSPLDTRFRGAWPLARPDEPARALALFESLALRDSLRDRFDVDWFRNPHAYDALRSSTLAWEPAEQSTLGAHAEALSRAFEGALA